MKETHLTHCIFCSSHKLYRVSPTQLKCSTCKRTFSEKKYLQNLEILNHFIANSSVQKCAIEMALNYITVKKIYQKIRVFLVNESEATYANQEKGFSQYDEYYFLSKKKKNDIKYLFDAIGILGMSYGNAIYTLLLPDQFGHLKQLSQNELETKAYKEEYAKYLAQHKVAHYETFDNQLQKFWKFLEGFMLHFKGVSKAHFIYYLKEAEFKFNHTQEAQKAILYKLTCRL